MTLFEIAGRLAGRIHKTHKEVRYAGEGAIHCPRGHVSGGTRRSSRCGKHAGGGVRRADRLFVFKFVVDFVGFGSVLGIGSRHVINGSKIVNRFVGVGGWLLVRFDVWECAEFG